MMNHQWDRQCVVIIQIILLTVKLPKSYCREPCVSNLFVSSNQLSRPEQFVDIVWCWTAFIEYTILIDLFVYFLCYYWYFNVYYDLHTMVIILILSIQYQLNFSCFGLNSILYYIWVEWVSDCWFTPLNNLCNHIMSWTSYLRWNDDFRFVLDKHA